MMRLSLGAGLPNWKFVRLDILELLAFNSKKFTLSRDPGHAPYSKRFSGVMGLSRGACLPNLKFVSLVILELFTFNSQKFKGSRDPGHTPFSKIFLRGHKTVIWICESSGSKCCLEKSN